MISKTGQIVLAVVVACPLLLCSVASGFYRGMGPDLSCERPAEGLAQPGWSARSLVSGGLKRCYYLYVPPQYDPARPAPLVVSFHGFLSNPKGHALSTGWYEVAAQEGFLVAYPQGTKFPCRWNAGKTWGNRDVDDVQFFHDLLDDLSAEATVDRSRVYVNGVSNGGGMAVKIGCEAADQVAAMGSVAGAVVDIKDCSPGRPVPVMAFHGTADPLLPYEGGELQGWLLRWAAGATQAPTFFVGAEDWVAAWAEGNGCDAAPAAIPPLGDVRGMQYTGCDEDAQVTLYTIEDGGHTWPGSWRISGVGKMSMDIDATEELWSFFRAYTLPGP